MRFFAEVSELAAGALELMCLGITSDQLRFNQPACLSTSVNHVSVLLIGAGSMLRSCLDIATREESVQVCLVLLKVHPEGQHKFLQSYIDRKNIRCVSYGALTDVIADIAALQPDIIVSVYNPDILRDDVLRLTRLAINFHDSMLPRYAGLNAPAWALLHGEPTYGVTWHVVVPTVDAGDIIAQSSFPIDPSWTALNLAAKCIESGCELFRELLPRIASGNRNFRPQDLTKRSYFSGKIRPFGGNFPFTLETHHLLNLQRATSYFPAANPFCMPKVRVNGTSFELVRFTITPAASEVTPGTIVRISEAGIAFALVEGTMMVDLIQDSDAPQRRASDFAEAKGFRPGDMADLIDHVGYATSGVRLPMDTHVRADLSCGDI